MTEQELKNAIACFDKKVTDYQISVDKCVQNVDKKVKSYENYVFGITTEIETAIDKIIEIQNALIGGVES